MASKFLPAHALRLYAWEILRLNTTMQLIDNRIPVVAIDDEPKIADAQKTYVIYGFSENQDAREFYKRRGVISFNIKSRTFGEMGQIINALTRAFENCDMSAAQVNAWNSAYVEVIPNPFAEMRFTEVEAIYSEAGPPDKTEGGPMHGMVNVSYEVIVQDSNFVLPAAAQHTLWA